MEQALLQKSASDGIWSCVNSALRSFDFSMIADDSLAFFSISTHSYYVKLLDSSAKINSGAISY